MKLRVNYLSRGRYWTAGEEIPDEDVPPNIRKYAVTVSEGKPSEERQGVKQTMRPLRRNRARNRFDG